MSSEEYERGFAAGLEAGRPKPWTEKDIETLVGWTGSEADLISTLGRSALAIRLKRHKLRNAGVEITPRRETWTDEQTRALKKWKGTNAAFGAKYGLSTDAVRSKRNRLVSGN